MELFAKATKSKYRFQTSRGSLSVENLWDLNLEALDTIAKGINKQLKESSEESFIEAKSSASVELTEKLDIVKSIIKFKLTQKEAAAKRAETQARKAELEGLIADKKSDALKSKSLEELEKMAAELE